MEGFASATRAAAAGGITTVVDMPLDSVPATVSADKLRVKRRAADGQCHVDVGFWAGVIPGNTPELEPLARAGVAGFKCFLADSGSPGFPPVDTGQLTEALRVTARLGLPLLVHAESAPAAPGYAGPSYAGYLASQPRGLENLAVAQVIEAARMTGGHAHVVHLSSSDALPMIASPRREGVRVSAETCPHYLTLTAEKIGDGQTAAKCSPPVREAANRELLWRGLRENVLDLVVSDHSPCTAAMKGPDFGPAWGGISSRYADTQFGSVTSAPSGITLTSGPLAAAGPMLHRAGHSRPDAPSRRCGTEPVRARSRRGTGALSVSR